MADAELSALTAQVGTSLVGTHEFYVNAGGTSKRMTSAELLAGLLATQKIASNVLFATHNTYDIGANGANGPRNAYIAGLVMSSNHELPLAGAYYWSSGATIRCSTDGIIIFGNSLGNGFTRLQLGGTTASFPALARDGIGLASRLADNSAGTWIKVGSFTVSGVPAAASNAGAIIYVSDEAGGAVLAFSDGTNWKRVTDRATIS